jgi:hypothetical protein
MLVPYDEQRHVGLPLKAVSPTAISLPFGDRGTARYRFTCRERSQAAALSHDVNHRGPGDCVMADYRPAPARA